MNEGDNKGDIPRSLQIGVRVLTRKIEEQLKKNAKQAYPWSAEDFEMGRLVGSGTFGQVYLVRERKTKMLFAMKIMSKRWLEEEQLCKQVLREISIHLHLLHPNIIYMHTYFHDKKYLYLVMDYALKGSVYQLLQRQKKFDERLAAKFVYQAADALLYCHEKGIIHRDLKPENLLLDENSDVKLSDFGWSVRKTSGKVQKVCGTTEYFSPEMVEEKPYDSSVDIWSLGVLCFEFLVGKTPFFSDTPEDMYNKIVSAEVSFPPHIPLTARDLISKLIVYEPKARLPLQRVMGHLWVVHNYNHFFRNSIDTDLSY